MSKIYVASSWRNEFQPDVVRSLRAIGHQVYDFKDDDGFSWKEIYVDFASWDIPRYLRALSHRDAERGFSRDMAALATCEICIMVMPCGMSASLEMGWACGAGKRTAIYVPAMREPDLMVKMAHFITADLQLLEEWVGHDHERGSFVRTDSYH